MSNANDPSAVSPNPLAFPEAELESTHGGPEDGMALCLSGGGYRAMLFHVGAILRLNEAGLLGGLKRVSSVSGGSITAAVLGLHWREMGFPDSVSRKQLDDKFIAPIRELASRSLDVKSALGGLAWFGSISDRIAEAYDEILFHGKTLQDLPSDDEGPRFVINATNVQSGALWRFSKPYMADYLVGMIDEPDVLLAHAVAASSAFPPFLSPFELELNHFDFKPDPKCPLQRPPFTTDVVLTDGGVYDNLGLETVWNRYRTILVSDAGGKTQPEEEPAHEWAQHSYRILNVVDNQVRSLRKRALIASYKNPDDSHDGTFWGIRTDIADYGLTDALPCIHHKSLHLAETPTRLKRLTTEHQNKLMNWGYAICDAALRKYVAPSLNAPSDFPFPDGIG